MITCPNCGHANAKNSSICVKCGQVLDAESLPPPRLLAHIQGLIPPEPLISTGKLSGSSDIPAIPLHPESLEEDQPPEVPEAEPVAAVELIEPAPVAESDVPETPTEEPEPELTIVVPPPSPPQPPPRQLEIRPAPKQPSRLPLLLLGLLALLLIALGLWWPAPRKITAPRRPSVETAYTFVEILPSRPTVLLAWDYEPTTQGEMQLFSVPILQHLHQKRARIANVSLRPTGPAVAAAALAQVESLQLPGAQAVRPQSVDFGFIPGDAAALRSLSVDTVGTANLPELSAQALGFGVDDTLASFDLIIEFSAETSTTQEWVEQIAARLDVPIVVAASGAVAPVLRPYEQTGQIAALMSGYVDALAYERLLHETGPASAQVYAQTLLNLFFITIVCIALLRSLFR